MRPADLGYTMPAEWAPHAGCWMAWPKRTELWQQHLEAARRDYAHVAQAIARYEPLTMIADPGQEADARRTCGPSVSIVTVALRFASAISASSPKLSPVPSSASLSPSLFSGVSRVTRHFPDTMT